MHLQLKHGLMFIVPVAIAVTAIAWSGSRNHFRQVPVGKEDTTPVKKNTRPHRDQQQERGPDRENDDLDRAMNKLGEMNFDFGKMEIEIEKSMKKVEHRNVLFG